MLRALEHLGVALSRLRRLVVRPEVGLGLLLIALTLVVYGRTVHYGFVEFDDPRYVAENPHVPDGLTIRGIRWAFSHVHDSNWIPLTWISLMLDATIHDRWAGGYHATNILLHSANVLLVFTLFTRATGKTLHSAFIAALLAIHPLHVESVAWVTERKDVLSIFFGLLSLSAYLTYWQRQRTRWLVVAFFLFLGSLASKQTLVTLPFVLLLLDFWPLGRFASGPDPVREDACVRERRLGIASLLVEKFPFLLGSVGFCAVALIAQSRGHSVRTLIEMPLSSRILNAILAASLYLRRAVFPSGLALFYPHPGPTLNLTVVALAIVVLSAITVLATVQRRRWPFLLVGWLWFLGTLVPMIGLVQIGLQQMADRYAYFPNLGLYLALAWLAPAIVSSSLIRRRALPVLAGGLVAVYAAMAFVQVGYWRDSMTLINHSLEVTGENAFGQTMLGDALFVQSRIDEALTQYRRAIELDPRNPISHSRLGDRLHHLKRFDGAAEQFRAAVQLDPSNAELHVGLGLALEGLGQYDASKREFERALELDGKCPQAHAGLALLSRTRRDFAQSTLYAEKALQLDDEFDYCRRLIAWNLFDQGHRAEAVERLRQAAADAPRDPEVHADLALVLSLTGERSAMMRQ